MADRLDLLGSRRRNGSTERDSQADAEQADNEIYIDAVQSDSMIGKLVILDIEVNVLREVPCYHLY